MSAHQKGYHILLIGIAADPGDAPRDGHQGEAAPGQQLAAGVPPDMVRISVGLEHIDDILWDIDQALAKSTGQQG